MVGASHPGEGPGSSGGKRGALGARRSSSVPDEVPHERLRGDGPWCSPGRRAPRPWRSAGTSARAVATRVGRHVHSRWPSAALRKTPKAARRTNTPSAARKRIAADSSRVRPALPHARRAVGAGGRVGCCRVGLPWDRPRSMVLGHGRQIRHPPRGPGSMRRRSCRATRGTRRTAGRRPRPPSGEITSGDQSPLRSARYVLLLDPSERSICRRWLSRAARWLTWPVAVAPMGGLILFHPQGDPRDGRAAPHRAIRCSSSRARAAGRWRTSPVASPGPKMFQLYHHGDRAWAADLIARCRGLRATTPSCSPSTCSF